MHNKNSLLLIMKPQAPAVNMLHLDRYGDIPVDMSTGVTSIIEHSYLYFERKRNLIYLSLFLYHASGTKSG